MVTLPLTPVANVVYNLPGVGAPRFGFNLGLILGTSTVISTTTRVVVYASLADMVTAGFATNSVEYLAATQYFAALPKPSKVAIGRKATGETWLAAIQDARAKNTDWYIAYAPAAANSDHTAIAAWIETYTTPYSQYFVQNSDAAVLNNTTGNLFATFKASAYKRTHGMYSTSSYALAGLMGYAMAQTTDFAGSAYTLCFKNIAGIVADALTTTQVTNIEGNNGNVYVNRGTFYTGYEKGNQFSGDWFDEIVYLDKLTNEIQNNISNLLYQTPKIPQTENGMAQLRAVTSAACQHLVDIGFIAAGVWGGQPILTLNTGDTLPNGFVVMSDPIAGQNTTDRGNRLAPNIYVAARLAGAIQSVYIQINVNR